MRPQAGEIPCFLGRLKRCTDLVLSFPSVSVDASTDAIIHKLVCESLPNTTVLSVIHRLDHLHLYDLVAVMADGQLVEMGPPSELLKDPKSAVAALYSHGIDG